MKPLLTTIAALALCGAAIAETPKAASREQASSGDEALALAALEGLMAQPGERALPIIKKVLAGSQTTVVKKRALFVLGQIETPEAQALLLQMARSTDASLRGEAIRSVGIAGEPKSLDALLDVYKSGGPDVKKDVLQAWMIADRKEAVYQAALSATSEDEANDAIRMLGAMEAIDELRKLNERPNAASGLVNAFAIAGDLASLRKIAEGTGKMSARAEAVRQIGIIDGEAAHVALREIYTRATEADIKDAALQGLMIADDEKGLLALYRSAKTSDEKRALLRYIGMIDGDAALEAIDAALGGNTPEARK